MWRSRRSGGCVDIFVECPDGLLTGGVQFEDLGPIEGSSKDIVGCPNPGLTQDGTLNVEGNKRGGICGGCIHKQLVEYGHNPKDLVSWVEDLLSLDTAPPGTSL